MPWKPVDDFLSIWAIVTYVGELDRVPSLWFHLSPALAIVAIVVIVGSEPVAGTSSLSFPLSPSLPPLPILELYPSSK